MMQFCSLNYADSNGTVKTCFWVIKARILSSNEFRDARNLKNEVCCTNTPTFKQPLPKNDSRKLPSYKDLADCV